MKKDQSSGAWSWWCRLLAIGGISLLILAWGISALGRAYSLKNPQEFIMMFFSSSFMILLGIAGLIYPACRIHAYLKDDPLEHLPEE
ncbi:MAG: hypothetical protein QM278_12150 [Pseudomonadota bacterium]|nr:hypothetical protein [Pseudomonadota bacterium]